VGVAVETDGEEDDQDQEQAEGNQEAFQDAAPWAARPAEALAAVDLRR
jgi:hypothetical protein